MRRAASCIALVAAALLLWRTGRTLQALALGERAAWPPSEEYAILPSPEAAPFLFLGYRELGADITWARLLVYYGSSRIGESDFRYLRRFIDNVIALDPRFEKLYRWAAYAVTFKQNRATQEEFRLSVHYLERGIREFPERYELFWLLGLRYWLDLEPKDEAERRRFRERGAELIEIAMRKPDAPPDLATFAASLRSRMGQRERAMSELREMILTTDNPQARRRMLARLRELSDSSELADEVARAAERFDDEWRRTLDYAPPGLYVLLGPAPDPAIDFDRLATERDLFGADLP
jgi:hypothetical protein